MNFQIQDFIKTLLSFLALNNRVCLFAGCLCRFSVIHPVALNVTIFGLFAEIILLYYTNEVFPNALLAAYLDKIFEK